jgi:hypothetical protein
VNAEQALYGAFIVKRFQSNDLSFLLSRSVSLFDVESRFFAPTRSIAKPARAGAVKVGRRPNLAAYSGLARPHLDSFEHDGRLDAVGTTIRGGLAIGRGSSRHNLVFGRSIAT